MFNNCQFIGNLGADPEVRVFDNGGKVANIRIAVTEKWKDKNTGEKREKTEWVPIAIFGPLAGIAEQYLRKGSRVFVSGKFQTRKWQDQQGNDRYSSEIVLQGPGSVLQMLGGGESGSGGGYSAPPQQQHTGPTVGSGVDDDSEIPF